MFKKKKKRPFGFSCSTSYKSSSLYCHWIHRSTSWPQIMERLGQNLQWSLLIYPLGSSRQVQRRLREMGEPGLRSLHNERRKEGGEGSGGGGEGGEGEGERESTELKALELQPLCFQKQWALREQWLQTKSWSIFICHCESQTGGTGFLPCTHSSNWIWAGRKMRSPRTLPA